MIARLAYASALGLSLLCAAGCGAGTSAAPLPNAPPPTTSGSSTSPVSAALASNAFDVANAAPPAKTGTVDPALAKGLKETSAWFAPGMNADGPTYFATLAASGRVKADLALKAGICYEFVGFSPDGQVTDFDLRLWTLAKNAPSKLVDQDGDDDTTPTVGKPPLCPEVATSYVLEMIADKGKGDVAVQVYSKAK